jgi:hypothetical protein
MVRWTSLTEMMLTRDGVVLNALGDSWETPVKGPSTVFAILFAITGIVQVIQNLYALHKTLFDKY